MIRTVIKITYMLYDIKYIMRGLKRVSRETRNLGDWNVKLLIYFQEHCYFSEPDINIEEIH